MSLKKDKIPKVMDPSTGSEVHPYILLQRTCAAVCLQRFYRHYIKWERDEHGQPIDPILKDGFDPKNQVRILYKSRLGDENEGCKYVTRLQVFDVETVWESIQHSSSGAAINPITNTPFSFDHFKRIVEKAAKIGLIKPEEVQAKLQSFGYGMSGPGGGGGYGPNLKSAYEPIDTQAQLKKVQKDRDHHFLAYFALINDFPMVERIIYKHMTEIEHHTFNVNFQRKRGQPLPSLPKANAESNQNLLFMLNKLAPIFTEGGQVQCQPQPTNLEPPEVPEIPQVDPMSISSNSSTSESGGILGELDLDTLVIDHELERASLPNYTECYNAIQACCLRGNREMLLFILQFGGDLSVQDPMSRVLPVHIALLERKIEILKVLVLYGAGEQLEIGSKFGTPLEIANCCLDEIPEIYSIIFGEFVT